MRAFLPAFLGLVSWGLFLFESAAWGGGHISMTEAALAVQPEGLKKRLEAPHRNDFTGRTESLHWYLCRRFCMHPDWVDGPTRTGEDVPERVRSTRFVYGERDGRFFPPIAYTDPFKAEKGPRPKTYHYFTYRVEEVNRAFALKGAHWYLEKIGLAFREKRDADAAEYLGAFLHAIQDRVSPYHVWDGYTERREALESRFSKDGLQSPEGSRNGIPKAASLFWSLGGEGMSNDLPENFEPSALGESIDEAAERFVERLFSSRTEAEKVYSDPGGFMKAHLADDWKNRRTSAATVKAMEAAAAENIRLCADVILTAWRLSGE